MHFGYVQTQNLASISHVMTKLYLKQGLGRVITPSNFRNFVLFLERWIQAVQIQ